MRANPILSVLEYEARVPGGQNENLHKKIDDTERGYAYQIQRRRASPSRLVRDSLGSGSTDVELATPSSQSNPPQSAEPLRIRLWQSVDCRPAQDGVKGLGEADFGLPPQFDVLPPVSFIPWPRRVGQSRRALLKPAKIPEVRDSFHSGSALPYNGPACRERRVSPKGWGYVRTQFSDA